MDKHEVSTALLTEKETAVIVLFMKGMKANVIADWTGMSVKQVSYYKRRAIIKLGVHNNSQLFLWFLDKNR